MEKEQKLLPLGSIVLLKEGTQKLMVMNRGVYYLKEDESILMDYMGCLYPEGIDPEQTIFFNQKDIDEVLFEGFSDSDEDRFQVAYQEFLDRESEE